MKALEDINIQKNKFYYNFSKTWDTGVSEEIESLWIEHSKQPGVFFSKIHKIETTKKVDAIRARSLNKKFGKKYSKWVKWMACDSKKKGVLYIQPIFLEEIGDNIWVHLFIHCTMLDENCRLLPTPQDESTLEILGKINKKEDTFDIIFKEYLFLYLFK